MPRKKKALPQNRNWTNIIGHTSQSIIVRMSSNIFFFFVENVKNPPTLQKKSMHDARFPTQTWHKKIKAKEFEKPKRESACETTYGTIKSTQHRLHTTRQGCTVHMQAKASKKKRKLANEKNNPESEPRWCCCIKEEREEKRDRREEERRKMKRNGTFYLHKNIL